MPSGLKEDNFESVTTTLITATWEVRRLTSDDLELFKGLMDMLGAAFEEPEVYCNRRPSDAYLERLLARPDFFAVVAVFGDEVIGGLTAYEWMKYEQERSEIYIYDLAVSGEHRRKGIATALLEYMIEFAKETGVSAVCIQAYASDPAPVSLYSKFRPAEDVKHFDIYLTPGHENF